MVISDHVIATFPEEIDGALSALECKDTMATKARPFINICKHQNIDATTETK